VADPRFSVGMIMASVNPSLPSTFPLSSFPSPFSGGSGMTPSKFFDFHIAVREYQCILTWQI
jgi:hypothetical protein